jgi:hypothetical protein
VILAAGTVPDDKLLAFNDIKFVPDPLKPIAAITPVDGLNDNFEVETFDDVIVPEVWDVNTGYIV